VFILKQYHEPHRKKVSAGTGGQKRKARDKKRAHVGGVSTSTRISDKDSKVERRKRGGKTAMKLKKAAFANVVTKNGTKKAKILRVLESHNPEYVRMNIITKGAVIETDAGKVRVTNRVGQDGIVNGVLVS
jgi:small subunit ribosomal protein S8e